ncbi:MAG: hypothetical protein PHW66_03740 [Gallionella sp.]|nr:hypothetical protein [Gallionella sp.]
MSNDYVVEKLTNAVTCLATGPGDARSRVAAAYICIRSLEEADFPADCREDWNWIEARLTKYGPLLAHDGSVIRGAVEHTMLRIKNRTAAKIATKIYHLYWKLSNNTLYR